MAYMRIKELRLERGLGQADLARCMGVFQSAVSNWETENALPRARDLPLLAQVLGVGIDDLYTQEARAVRPTAS